MMEKFNAWIEKVGVDKLLHFFVAAWIVSECKYFGTFLGIFGLSLVVVFSIVKECYIDKETDSNDGLWSFMGGALSLVIMFLL